MIKTIYIQKNDNKTKDTQPDRRLSAKVDDKFIDIGSGWIKEGKNGQFISAQLSNSREYQGKKYDGYVIITEDEYSEYLRLKSANVKVPEMSVELNNWDKEEIPF